MENNAPKLTIKNWAEADRPREKLLVKGRQALSDAELLAIILGSGTRTLSAVDLAKVILQANKNNLNELSKRSVKELTKYKGVGEAKAISIVAAMELARRKPQDTETKSLKINSSQLLYEAIRPNLEDLSHEQFWVILMSRSLKIIQMLPISSGGVSGTVVDLKLIFKSAVEHLASALAVAHNHPSGSINPSTADKEITRKIQNACQILDINFIDHIIVGNLEYYSFADNNLLA